MLPPRSPLPHALYLKTATSNPSLPHLPHHSPIPHHTIRSYISPHLFFPFSSTRREPYLHRRELAAIHPSSHCRVHTTPYTIILS
ncbi:hypothetical protein L484_023679 [Morus notabilis]|uniref:Uncharacterized protein n=1 Tax=Morus notabilis TaxID=981085 RepID=W9RDV5_9ROSA|nr:hypothetical protein L484_023679 [Morus notabilis]